MSVITLTSLAHQQAAFPVLDCSGCGSRGLAYVDYTASGHELLRCLRCNASAPAQGVTLATHRAVEALGYVFLHRAKANPKASKLSGCGAKGVKSCGTGGCSSGSCGTGGGCGSGGGGCGTGGGSH
jgi:hypothetical protein